MREIWKAIERSPAYSISSLGRVKGPKGWILKQPIRNGYCSISLYTDKKTFTRENTHTLVLETFVGPRPDGFHARHLDGDRKNNSVSNLRWGSPKENAADQFLHGTRALGLKHHNAKLNADIVRSIRDGFDHGFGPTALAKKYGVDPSTITSVVRRQTWAHVT